MAKKPTDGKSEIDAVSAVFTSLKDLDPSVQGRVLRYVAEMLGISLEFSGSGRDSSSRTEEGDISTSESPVSGTTGTSPFDDAEGINSVALKWMTRSGLNPKLLEPFFSLGIDEIDLVTEAVPGSNKKERMRSVLLLKGIAAYLSSGVARVSYEQLKEACLHYDAYDAANFASYLKSFSPDAGGSKGAGYTLSPRGLTTATTLLKGMLAQPKK